MSPFDDKYISEEIRKNAELSQKEVEDMFKRTIHCPHCNFAMLYVYDDLHLGHVSAKCPKCKNISDLNLGYFKHQREPKCYLGLARRLPDFA